MAKKKDYYFNIIKKTKKKGNSYYIRIVDNINDKTFHHDIFFTGTRAFLQVEAGLKLGAEIKRS